MWSTRDAAAFSQGTKRTTGTPRRVYRFFTPSPPSTPTSCLLSDNLKIVQHALCNPKKRWSGRRDNWGLAEGEFWCLMTSFEYFNGIKGEGCVYPKFFSTEALKPKWSDILPKFIKGFQVTFEVAFYIIVNLVLDASLLA